MSEPPAKRQRVDAHETCKDTTALTTEMLEFAMNTGIEVCTERTASINPFLTITVRRPGFLLTFARQYCESAAHCGPLTFEHDPQCYGHGSHVIGGTLITTLGGRLDCAVATADFAWRKYVFEKVLPSLMLPELASIVLGYTEYATKPLGLALLVTRAARFRAFVKAQGHAFSQLDEYTTAYCRFNLPPE